MKPLHLGAIEAAAQTELAWYYQHPEARAASPSARAAAERIERWLRSIKTFHGGALALTYAPRVWPDAVAEYFGPLAGIAVRLECAAHPAIGIATLELETAAAWRLSARLVEGARLDGQLSKRALLRGVTRTPKELRGYKARARQYLDEALTAYVAARAWVACVVPPPEEEAEEAPDTLRDPVPTDGEEVAS